MGHILKYFCLAALVGEGRRRKAAPTERGLWREFGGWAECANAAALRCSGQASRRMPKERVVELGIWGRRLILDWNG
jgi:hypothetical protein